MNFHEAPQLQLLAPGKDREDAAAGGCPHGPWNKSPSNLGSGYIAIYGLTTVFFAPKNQSAQNLPISPKSTPLQLEV